MAEVRQTRTQPIKVLIVGNGDAQLDLLRTIFGGLGHEVIGAASDMHAGTLPGVGDGAVSGSMVPELFFEERPDLVIIDLQAEDSGSYGTIEALRRLENGRWLPVWCLGTGGADESEHSLALDSGADVYMPRPVSIPLLKSRLSQLERFLARQRQQLRRTRHLQEYFEAAEGEIKTARAIMDSLLRTDAESASVLQSWIAPAFKFSGDAMLAERSPDGSLKLLLADGVGHGLSAALNVLPVARAFQSMAQKGFGLPAMVVELNHTIRRDLPSHRFVAATLVNINAGEGVIEVWNGGNPAAIMMDTLGDVIDVWSSQHLPLGIVDSDELDPRPDVRPLRPDSQLMLFSDGAIEAMDDNGQAFGEANLVRTLSDAPPSVRLEALKFAVVEHLAGRAANDDVTLALLDCSGEFKQSQARRSAEINSADQGWDEPASAATCAWEMALVVESERLRDMDIVPILQEFVGRIDPAWARDESGFTMLSERYARALEQGLLKLDARIKERPDGLSAYARARRGLLQDLEAPAVRVSISRCGDDAQLRVGMQEAVLPGGRPAQGEPAGSLWMEGEEPETDLPAETMRETIRHPRDGMDVATIRLHALPPAH